MAPVLALAVDDVDVPHQQRQIRAAGVQHEVVVVAHKSVREHLRVEAFQTLLDDCQQRSAILVVRNDALSPVATRSHVVHGSEELGFAAVASLATPAQSDRGFKLWT
jgi:hypothetical protein